MKRRAFNCFCLFSLLVFVGSVTLWVRSYFVGETIEFNSGELDAEKRINARGAEKYFVILGRGAVLIARNEFDLRGRVAGNLGWEYRRSNGAPIRPSTGRQTDGFYFQLAGFEFANYSYALKSGGISEKVMVLPLWLFLPAAIPPFLWWRRRRKQGGRGFEAAMAEKTE